MKSDIQCLISAGPTREWIDPVRFISNPSSGKMGYALAQSARKLGMEVILVSGPVSLNAPEGVTRIMVETAEEMNDVMLRQFHNSQLTIMSAAVCDHRPKTTLMHKLKKSLQLPHLELVPNPDILENLGKIKKRSQILVGFAAETENHLVNAKAKIEKKNLDWIALNDVSSEDQGFQSDFNTITILSKDGKKVILEQNTKFFLADKILEIVSA